MDWTNWQSYAALAIIIVTIFIFVRRFVRAWFLGKDQDCCGGRCGCSFKKDKKLKG